MQEQLLGEVPASLCVITAVFSVVIILGLKWLFSADNEPDRTELSAKNRYYPEYTNDDDVLIP